jgi:hypothetical protein
MKVYADIYRGKKESREGRRPGKGLSEANREQLEMERVVSEIYKESKTYNWTWSQGL